MACNENENKNKWIDSIDNMSLNRQDECVGELACQSTCMGLMREKDRVSANENQVRMHKRERERERISSSGSNVTHSLH